MLHDQPHRPPHRPAHEPPPPPHGAPPPHAQWENTLPEEMDLATLERLLGDRDTATSVWRHLKQRSPEEIASMDVLLLRMFRQIEQAFPERFGSIVEENSHTSQSTEGDNK